MTDAASRRRWVLMLGTIIAIGPLTIDMYLPALPTLQTRFGVDTAAVQLTLSAYFIGFAAGQLVYGPLADRFGRRGPLLFSLVLYTAASAACAAAPDIRWLIAARFVQALGGCGPMVVIRAMLRDRFEPQEMARIMSGLMLVMGVAPIVAPLLGAQILLLSGWREIFLVLVAFGAACFSIAWLGLSETQRQPGPPLRPRRVLSDYGRLLRSRHYMGYTMAAGCASAGMFAYISGSSFVFIDVYGVPPELFGFLFGANAAGLILGTQVNARLLRYYGAEHILRVALTTFFVFGMWLVVMALSGLGGLWGIAVPLFFCISTLGFSMPNASAVAMAPFAAQAGTASALIGALQFTVAALAGAAVGHFHDGTALPMTLVVATCGLAAVTLVRLAPAVSPRLG